MILYLVLILDPILHAQVHTKTAYESGPPQVIIALDSFFSFNARPGSGDHFQRNNPQQMM